MIGASLLTLINWWLFHVLASILSCGFLLVSWWMVLLWYWRHRPIYLVVAGIFAGGGIGAAYIFYQYTYSWAVALVLIVLFGILLIPAYRSLPLPTRRLSRHLALASLAATLLVPSAYLLSTHGQPEPSATALTDHLTAVTTAITSKTDQVRAEAVALAKESYVANDLAKADIADLGSRLQKILISQNLQAITITDGVGTVVVRAHQLQKSGDNIYTTQAWSAPAYRGTVVAGLASGEQAVPLVAAAAPIIKDDRITGVVLLGSALNDQSLALSTNDSVSVALATDDLLLSAPTATQDPALFHTAAFTDAARTHLEALRRNPQAAATWDQFFTLDSKKYRVHGEALSTLLPNQPFFLIGLSPT